MSEDVTDYTAPSMEPEEETVEEAEDSQKVEGEETPEITPEQAEKTAVQKRIDELTREKYSARRQTEQANAEIAQLRESIAAAQKQRGENPDVDQVRELIRQEAERIASDKSFNDACNTTYAKGKAEFADFDKSVENLQMVGVNRDFLEIVSSSDQGARIIQDLGKNLDEAARISFLTPLQMARELAKLEIKLASQPKGVSKAPAPLSHISGSKASARKSTDIMTDDEYAVWRKGGK